MQINKKKWTKREILIFIYHNFLVVLGTVMFGFGTAIFLTENTIVAGGLAGIGFIVQHFMPEGTMVIDIIVWVASAILWVVSIIFLGKDFAFKTLISTIVYPLSLTLFYRIDAFRTIVETVSYTEVNGQLIATTGDLLLCSIFGGLINGFGLAITFLGKGSTGGTDVISFLMEKYLKIKVSVASLFTDLTIIIVAMFVLSFPNYLVNCLVGIIASIATMMMVDLIYTRSENAVILDVISTEWETITKHIINDLERGVSLIDIEGAYTSTKRKMIRTVLSKNEYIHIKNYLSKVDPNAFLTFTETNAVFGEGFKENHTHHHQRLLTKIMGDEDRQENEK